MLDCGEKEGKRLCFWNVNIASFLNASHVNTMRGTEVYLSLFVNTLSLSAMLFCQCGQDNDEAVSLCLSKQQLGFGN